tara:strand:- start:312 stop:533 length:222 start_codon:yes stop_codon:yes gene_type:complete
MKTQEQLEREFKYIVTVGDHPNYKKFVRSKLLENAEQWQNKLARQFRNDSIDLFEIIDGKRKHKSSMRTVSFG